MNSFLIVLVAIGVPALADARAFTQHTANITDDNAPADRRARWFDCEAEGNFPDPTTCDCYIACTRALNAYQMPCAMGNDGERLWYVRNSGPDPRKSVCDYRTNVDCDLTPVTTEEPSATNGTCPDGLKDGDSCDPLIDCDQCGSCDWYFVCEANSGNATEGKWRRKECDVRGNPDTEIIRVADKMFFHRGATSYGGMCAPGIPSELEDEYTQDENCKLPCEFKKDEGCVRAYWYLDPDYTRGIWSDPGTQLLCPVNTKWDQAKLTCVFCADTEDCTCDPTTTSAP